MMSHSHLYPKSSHGHQRHLHTSCGIFLIVGSGALLVVVDRPWSIRVLLGPFRVNCWNGGSTAHGAGNGRAECSSAVDG